MSTTLEIPSGSTTPSGTSATAQQSSSSSSLSCSSSSTTKIGQINKNHESPTPLQTKYVQLKHNKDNKNNSNNNNNIGTIITDECGNGLIMNSSVINFTTNDVNNAHIFKLTNNELLQHDIGNSDIKTYCITGTSDQLQKHQLIQSSGAKLNLNNIAFLQKSSNHLSQQLQPQQHHYNQHQKINIVNKNNGGNMVGGAGGGSVTFANAFITKASATSGSKILNIPIKTTGLIQQHQLITKQNTKLGSGNITQKLGVPRNALVRLSTSQQQNNVVHQQNTNIIMARAPSANINQQLQHPQKQIFQRQASSAGSSLGAAGTTAAATTSTDFKQNMNSAINKNTQKTSTTTIIPAVKLLHTTSGDIANSSTIQKSGSIGNIKTIMPHQITCGNKVTSVKTLNTNPAASSNQPIHQPHQQQLQQVTIVGSNQILKHYASAGIAQNNTPQIQYHQSKNIPNQTIINNNNNASLKVNTSNTNMKIQQQQHRTNINLQVNNLLRQNSVQKVSSNKQSKFIVQSSGSQQLPMATHIVVPSSSNNNSTNANINNNNSITTTLINGPIKLTQSSTLVPHQIIDGNSPSGSTIKYVNAQGNIIQTQPNKLRTNYQQSISSNSSNIHISGNNNNNAGTNMNNPQIINVALNPQQSSQTNNQFSESYSDYHIPNNVTNTAANTLISSKNETIIAGNNTSNNNQQDSLMIVNGTAMSDEMSARILQSLSQKSVYNNRFHYTQSQQQEQQQQHHNYSINNDKINNELSTQGIMGSSINNQQQQQALNIKNISGDGGHKIIPDYFRVNSSEVQSMSVASVDNIPLHNAATIEHSLLQQQLHPQNYRSSPISSILHNLRDENSGGTTTSGTATSVNSDHDDDIIGIEVRPAPVTISDGKLQLLQAVLQDHTYVASMPPVIRLINEQTTNISNNNVYVNNSSNNVNTTSNCNNNTNICNNTTTTYSHFNQHIIANCNNSNTNINANINSAPAQLTAANLPYDIHSSNNDDDANSVISTGSRCGLGNEFDNDLGEETETAPEGEGEDDSVTRCICDLVHDDGYMICCDKCSAWQHVDCMGIDRQNIPDEYKCEICQPRQVDKMRARQLQLMKRKEQQLLSIHNNTTNINLQTPSVLLLDGSSNNINSQQLDCTISRNSSMSSLSSGVNSTKKTKSTLSKRKNDVQGKSSYGSLLIQKRTKRGISNNNNNNNMIGPDGKILLTKSGKPRRETKKSIKRKLKNQTAVHNRSNNNNMEQSNTLMSNEITNNTLSIPIDNKHTSNLRQWIENYEKAVTNHYSPELRARLQSIIKQQNLQSQQTSSNSSNNFLKNIVNIDQMCTIVPHAGGKILISTTDIEPHKPIVEIRGKYMLSNQYKQQLLQSQPANLINNNCNNANGNNAGRNNNLSSNNSANQMQQQSSLSNILRNNPGPFIFFYRLINDGTEICIDTRTYGNEARFVRRSCRPNAEIQHSIEKGIIHLYIVSLTNIIGSTEITIKHEPHDLLALQQNCNNNYLPTSTICACGLTKDCLFYFNSQTAASIKSPTNNNIDTALISTTRSSKLGSKRSNGNINYDSSNIHYKRGGKITQASRGRSTSSSGCDSNVSMISPINTPQAASPFTGLAVAYTSLSDSNISNIINGNNQTLSELKQPNSPKNINNNSTIIVSKESESTVTKLSLHVNDHEIKQNVIDQEELIPSQPVLLSSMVSQPLTSPTSSSMKLSTPVKQYQPSLLHRKTPGKYLKQFSEDANLTPPDNNLVPGGLSKSAENLITLQQQQPTPQPQEQQHSEEIRIHKKLQKEGNIESSSISSRKLTREERKMEAIVKAFEKMEKNQQRRQELKQHRGPSKRTNSGSMSPKRFKDSDESLPIINNTCLQLSTSSNNHLHRKKKRKGNKSYPITTQSRKSRRSRLNSGDSDILTSEESTSLLSPPLPNQINIINQSSSILPYNELEQRSPSDPHVSTAAGLLLAFANPKTSNQNTGDIVSLGKMECKQSSPSNSTISTTITPPLVSSTCLLVEAAVGPLEHLENNFKLPQKSLLISNIPNSLIGTKTKKTIMIDWLNQSDNIKKTINNNNNIKVNDSNYLQKNKQTTVKSVPTKAAGKSFDTLVDAAAAAASDTVNIKPLGTPLSNNNGNKNSNYHHVEEEPENLSIVAKKVEEFINQNELIHHQQQIYQEYNQNLPSNTDYENVNSVNEIVVNNYVNNVPLQWKNQDIVMARLPEQEQQQQHSNGITYQLALPAISPSCVNSGSAVKKRWLRQAISEECGDDIPSPPNGCMTPPKKRRIARQCSDISDTNDSMHIRPTAINSLIQASMASPLSNSIIFNTDSNKDEFTQIQIDSFGLNSNVSETNVNTHQTEEDGKSSALTNMALTDMNLNIESIEDNDEDTIVHEIKEEEEEEDIFDSSDNNIDVDEVKEDIAVKKYMYECGNEDNGIVHYIDTSNIVESDKDSQNFISENIKVDDDTLNVDVKIDKTIDLQYELKNNFDNGINSNEQEDDIDVITLPTNEENKNNNLVKIEPEDLTATNNIKIDVELDLNEQKSVQVEENNNNKIEVLIRDEKILEPRDEVLNDELLEYKFAQVVHENNNNTTKCSELLEKVILHEPVDEDKVTFKEQPMEYQEEFINHQIPINNYNPNLIVIELKNNDKDDTKQIIDDNKMIINDNNGSAVQQPPDIEDLFDDHKYNNQNLNNNFFIKQEEQKDGFNNNDNINSKRIVNDIDEKNKTKIELMADSDKVKQSEEEAFKMQITYDESTTTSTIDEIADIQKRLHSFHTENILILKSRNRKIKSARTSLSPPCEKINSSHNNNNNNNSKSSTIINRSKNKRPVQLNFDLSVSEDQTVSVKLKDEVKSESEVDQNQTQTYDKMKLCGEERIILKQQHHDDNNWDKENSCIKFSTFANLSTPPLSPTPTQQQSYNASSLNKPSSIPPPPPLSPSSSNHQILTVAQLRSAVAAVTNLPHEQQYQSTQTTVPTNNFASHYSSIYGKFSGESREYLEAANNCIAGTQNGNINLMLSDYLDNSSISKLITNPAQSSYPRSTIPSSNINANNSSNVNNNYLSTLDPTRMSNTVALSQQSHSTTYYTGNTNVGTPNIIIPINNVSTVTPSLITPIGNTILAKSYSSFASNNLLPITPPVNVVYQSTNIVNTTTSSTTSNATNLKINSNNNNTGSNSHPTTPIQTHNPRIYARPASADPRLNPNLNIPEPPPVPKRKLSINEYRKRKQQTTNVDSIATTSTVISASSGTSSINSATTSLSSISSSSSRASSNCNSMNNSSNSSSPISLSQSNTTTPLTAMKKCKNNKLDECDNENHNDDDDDDDEDRDINSILTVELLTIGKSLPTTTSIALSHADDHGLVHFSPAPTLLELQQENLAERLKSYKSLTCLNLQQQQLQHQRNLDDDHHQNQQQYNKNNSVLAADISKSVISDLNLLATTPISSASTSPFSSRSRSPSSPLANLTPTSQSHINQTTSSH